MFKKKNTNNSGWKNPTVRNLILFSGYQLAQTVTMKKELKTRTMLRVKGKGKGMVLYSAVSSPLDRSKRLTLSSPGRAVHSDTNSAYLGSILTMQQLRNDYSLKCPPLSIARYSFIQLSRLRRREENENAQTSKR